MNRPNILFLMTDQQRHDALGCAGNEQIQTPNIDALAASGVRFRQACTPTPVCVAARMSLITGHRVSRTHWVANHKLPGPAPELPTIMTLLHDAGYWNHCVGKAHFFGRHYGLHAHERSEEILDSYIEDDYLTYLRQNKVRSRQPNGFRDLLYFQPQTSGIPLQHHKTTWVTGRSIEFLRRHARYNRQKPFFLWTSWTAPHPPFAVPEPYNSLYDPAEMELPIYADRPLADLPYPAWKHRGRLDGAHTDPERLRRIRALYYGMTTHVDDGVGSILAELERLGLADNTVVIFFSDHGDMLGDHGLSQKNVPYEHSVRVPLIVRWPGQTEAGRVSDDLVGLTDILPTLIHGTGFEYPVDEGPLSGESLLSAPGGGLASERNAYWIDFGMGQNRWIAMRSRSHKYALWAAGGQEELYDLQRDPWETQNIAQSEPALAAAHRERLLAWERTHGLSDSFDGGAFRLYPVPAVPDEDPREIIINDSQWPDNLPDDEQGEIESFAEAFTNAVVDESSLSPEKLSIAEYKAMGGVLHDTPWEEAWRRS